MTIFKLFLAVLLLSLFFISFQNSPRKIIGKEIYTSAQPDIKKLVRFISKYKIRSVVNLRGENNKEWFTREKNMLETKGIQFYNIKLSANRVAPSYEILKVFDIYENLKYPVLIHCKDGFDRSYFFVSLLMKMEGKEIEKRYFFKPKIWDFFKEYEDYLKRNGFEDKKEVLREYLENYYIPKEYKYDLIFKNIPNKIENGKKMEFEIEVINRSEKVWILKDSQKEGIRLGVILFGPFDTIPQNLEKYFYENEERGIEYGRIGIENGKVFPEGEKYFKFFLPLPDKKGKYFFAFDMVNENVSWFYYYGKAPYFFPFEVN